MNIKEKIKSIGKCEKLKVYAKRTGKTTIILGGILLSMTGCILIPVKIINGITDRCDNDIGKKEAIEIFAALFAGMMAGGISFDYCTEKLSEEFESWSYENFKKAKKEFEEMDFENEDLRIK